MSLPLLLTPPQCEHSRRKIILPLPLPSLSVNEPLIFQIFIPEMSDLISSNIREQKCKSVIAEFYYYHRKCTICYTRVFVIEKQLNTTTMADQ